VDEILQEVENNTYNPVVMGAHGQAALADALMGSTEFFIIFLFFLIFVLSR
jgi:hypothetical protein